MHFPPPPGASAGQRSGTSGRSLNESARLFLKQKPDTSQTLENSLFIHVVRYLVYGEAREQGGLFFNASRNATLLDCWKGCLLRSGLRTGLGTLSSFRTRPRRRYVNKHISKRRLIDVSWHVIELRITFNYWGGGAVAPAFRSRHRWWATRIFCTGVIPTAVAIREKVGAAAKATPNAFASHSPREPPMKGRQKTIREKKRNRV